MNDALANDPLLSDALQSDALLSNAEYLPFKLDIARQQVLLLRLTQAQRADASFLDERALPAEPSAVWVPLSALPLLPLQTPLDFIFHIGHCGSTLLSRLLQSWPQMQVLREPLPLRTLAADLVMDDVAASDAQAHTAKVDLLDRLLGLWSRTQTPATRTTIKVTSSCNDVIVPLLQRAAQSRAILLDMPLPAYLATLFKAKGSINDALSTADARYRYLCAQCDVAEYPAEDFAAAQMTAVQLTAAQTTALQVIEPHTIAQQCAMVWLAEQMRFDALSKSAYSQRILRIDFHALLADPELCLHTLAQHFELDASGVDTALASPVWRQYAKATGHAYSQEDRQHDLATAQRLFGAQIADGVDWVARCVAQSPQLQRAMTRAPR